MKTLIALPLSSLILALLLIFTGCSNKVEKTPPPPWANYKDIPETVMLADIDAMAKAVSDLALQGLMMTVDLDYRRLFADGKYSEMETFIATANPFHWNEGQLFAYGCAYSTDSLGPDAIPALRAYREQLIAWGERYYTGADIVNTRLSGQTIYRYDPSKQRQSELTARVKLVDETIEKIANLKLPKADDNIDLKSLERACLNSINDPHHFVADPSRKYESGDSVLYSVHGGFYEDFDGYTEYNQKLNAAGRMTYSIVDYYPNRAK